MWVHTELDVGGLAKGKVCRCIKSLRLGSCERESERESMWVHTNLEVEGLAEGRVCRCIQS